MVIKTQHKYVHYIARWTEVYTAESTEQGKGIGTQRWEAGSLNRVVRGSFAEKEAFEQWLEAGEALSHAAIGGGDLHRQRQSPEQRP